MVCAKYLRIDLLDNDAINLSVNPQQEYCVANRVKHDGKSREITDPCLFHCFAGAYIGNDDNHHHDYEQYIECREIHHQAVEIVIELVTQPNEGEDYDHTTEQGEGVANDLEGVGNGKQGVVLPVIHCAFCLENDEINQFN